MRLICGCGVVQNEIEIIILQDIKDFESRKMFVSICPDCKKVVLTLVETRKSDKKVFANENLTDKKAIKILTQEQKRVIRKFEKVKSSSLFGWVYGRNVQIKNKKGEVVQIRQYASDFKGKKELVKKIYMHTVAEGSLAQGAR